MGRMGPPSSPSCASPPLVLPAAQERPLQPPTLQVYTKAALLCAPWMVASLLPSRKMHLLRRAVPRPGKGRDTAAW